MTLSDAHSRLLKALANCIVPPDDTPGAGDIGDLNYVNEVLSGDLASQQGAVLGFLDGLDASATTRHQRAFADLDRQAQEALLATVEGDAIFQMLVALIQEGYWGSAAGFAAIGFEVSL